jgi:hypothetical protein
MGALGVGRCPKLLVGLLRRLLAQHMQERGFGRLSAVAARALERVASGEATTTLPSRGAGLSRGTRLIREWNGQTIAVEVLEKGFRWDERTYGSLSEIARAVTGAHWSGPRFFGLKRHG